MKRIIKTSLALFATAIGLSSCLDDKGYTDLVNGVGNDKSYVSFFGDEAALRPVILEATDKPKYDTLVVSFASTTPPTQDVTVTVDFDAAAIAAYNKSNGASFSTIPTSAFNIINKSVVIKAGKREAKIAYSLVGKTLAKCESFLLPIAIKTTSAGIVAGNYSTAYISAIVPENPFAGAYLATGVFTHPVNGPRDINEAKTLSTVDCSTVETNFADLGGSGWKMWLKINADKTVTIIPKGNANTATVQSGINIYDPVKKQFILNYSYPNAATGDRVISEKITVK
jgi:hypothetical protein